MKEEVCAAVKFFLCFLEKSEKVPREQLSNFEKHLTDLLIERFERHWFPDLPSKGQGYRCIRVNGLNPVDLTLEMAALKCGLRYKDLRLPTELTVWVDPTEVCYRLGESEGSYCTLASFPNSDASSTTSSTSSSNPPSTSSSPRPLSPPSSPRSPARTPTPPHQQSIGRRPGHVQRPVNQSMPGRSPPTGAYPGSGFDYGAQLGKFRNAQGGFAGGNGGGRQNRQTPREMNFNNTFSHPHHRPMYPRCDGPPFPTMAPPFYRNMNYNRNYHKNVLRV
ncbi:protein BTG4-like [Anthonomus grandis grandis]|uniref:protein BTG4-like n=1 Tax=Anthonomus grandis grandis TaxID=2921223 RepID=UPI00216541D4|nr:protein BTG4-like [Anthonomus grandis grandis]